MTATTPSTLNTLGGIVSQGLANALILFLLLRRPRLILRHLHAALWLVLLAALAVLSTLWSLDPLLTLRRSIPFALAALLGVYFGARFSQPRQLAILRLTMVALALATILAVLFVPAVGLDHSPGHAADWQGIFTHKNACGRMMVLATAVILFGDTITPGRFASLTLFAFVLVMSGSRGAWLITGALVLLWIAVRLARRSSPWLSVILAAAPIGALVLGAGALASEPQLAALLGRDPTLSGRTAIWSQVLQSAGQHPLLGYGYNAFWRGMQGPSLQVSAAVHFIVVHAHNGFLEIVLELGAAGLLLVGLTALRGMRQVWCLWRDGPVESMAFPVAVLFLVILCDLDENTLLLYNGLFWILCVAALVSLDVAYRDRRHTGASAPHAILTLGSRSAKVLARAAVGEIV